MYGKLYFPGGASSLREEFSSELGNLEPKPPRTGVTGAFGESFADPSAVLWVC
jgi:hypothetical protein